MEAVGSEPVFELDEVFGPDYLYFYEERLGPEVSDAEAGQIRELLQLRPGMTVLDAPCGHGRIANRLAARSAEVTGVDRSAEFLDLARKQAAELGVTVRYVQADLRDLPELGTFDRVVNWFTSFGYFGDRLDRQLLERFRRALKPGGFLLIEHQNRDRLLRTAQGAFVEERDGDLLIDRPVFDPLAGRMDTERIVVRGGGVKRSRFSVRVFAASEIRSWLEDAGFHHVRVVDRDGSPFTPESRRMVVLATA